MTAYANIHTVVFSLFGLMIIILITGAVVSFVDVCVYRLDPKYRLYSALIFAAAMFLMQCMTGTDSFFCIADERFNCGITAVSVALLFAAEAFLFFTVSQSRKNKLYAESIKESLDSLPDGVCFFDADGHPILVNSRMHKISAELFDTEILNADLFYNSMKENKIAESEKIICTSPTVMVQTVDGKVWDLRKNQICSEKKDIFELIAYDVTEQYRLSEKLSENNERLNRVNQRLLQYSRDLEETAADNALLKAKIQVHDDVGGALLAFRQYLNKPLNAREREKLLLLWQSTIKILKQEAAPENSGGGWDEILKAAEAVGVTVELNGMLPQDKAMCDVIFSAAHECLTNTVKHAGGDKLRIVLQDEEGRYIAEFTNNGALPRGEIKETGGLKNLHSSVEKVRGIMHIESLPQFLLRIELLKEMTVNE